ncbi:MAG: ASKHA domain-containing protein [Pseudomonadota bacterium]
MAETVTVGFEKSESGGECSSRVAVGTLLLDAATEAGCDITATCGRRGRCRSCRVKLVSGGFSPPTVQDRVQLGHDDVQENYRLACQTRVIADGRVLPAPPSSETGHQIRGDSIDSSRRDYVFDPGVRKYKIVAAIPLDENEQSSDVDAVCDALPDNIVRRLPMDLLRRLPNLLRGDSGKVTVTCFNDDIINLEAGHNSDQIFGMAFDIGTTSIVGTLIDLTSGEELASVSNVNPQAVYGADLMSRLAYGQFDEKKIAVLRGRVLSIVNEFIDEACEKANVTGDDIYKIVVVGNTCMHHLFLGIDTSYVGLAPYAPTVSDGLVIPAKDIPLKRAPNAQVCLLPIVAGFVGADTMAAILATKIYQSDEVRALVDIGTNGEVVMGSKAGLMACSAPAGPALEGGQIQHGMRAALGAIEKATIDEDVHLGVVGDLPPIGICGSGLIDLVAKMLDAGILNTMGRFRDKEFDSLPPALAARFVSQGKIRAFLLVQAGESGKDESIVLTQMDIRQLQLAKAAIYAGVLMLQELMSTNDDDLAELMICGGFGSYIDIESAVRIRLIPDLPLERISFQGNAAHIGAQLALLSETERQKAEELARTIHHVSLATRPEFQDIFVEACNLGSSKPEKLPA